MYTVLLKQELYKNLNTKINFLAQKVTAGPDVLPSLNRLLHAVPEQREEEELSVLQQELISGLAELYQTSRGADAKRGKKREKASS